MPKEKPPRLIFSATTEMQDWIREFRFANRIGTESEAIRQLILAGLEAKGIEIRTAKKGKS